MRNFRASNVVIRQTPLSLLNSFYYAEHKAAEFGMDRLVVHKSFLKAGRLAGCRVEKKSTAQNKEILKNVFDAHIPSVNTEKSVRFITVKVLFYSR